MEICCTRVSTQFSSRFSSGYRQCERERTEIKYSQGDSQTHELQHSFDYVWGICLELFFAITLYGGSQAQASLLVAVNHNNRKAIPNSYDCFSLRIGKAFSCYIPDYVLI